MIKTLLLLSLASFIFVHSNGQMITVKGRVVDLKKNTLPGANVIVKGTTNGTITDVNGAYSLQANPNQVLIFSFIGYISQEQAIEGKTEINVSLAENLNTLGEVVVVGYGTQNTRDISTAIVSVKADDLEKTPVPSLDQALQGRMSGVQVIKNTGAPGSASYPY